MMSLQNNKLARTDEHITVRDHNAQVNTISFDAVLHYHEGDSWFGCAAGFRAMQVATNLLFADDVLDQSNLYIVSGHPGPGVRDAIEVITKCVSSNRYQLLDLHNTKGCNRDMRFEWWVSNGRHTAHTCMKTDIVPHEFFDIAERVTSGSGNDDDKNRFDLLKSVLCERLMSSQLEQVFDGEALDTPLAPGELPDA